jgi:hypothetical protein
MSVFLQSLLGIISAHLVSAIIVLVAIVALVWGLYRVAGKNGKAIGFIAGVLDSARAIVKMFLPDKFEAVYEALVIAAQAASDGSLSTAEAKDLARKGFDAALKAANVSLTDVEKEQAYNILDWLIEQIIKDPAAAAKALSAL